MMRKNGQAKRRARNSTVRGTVSASSRVHKEDSNRTWHVVTGWGEYNVRAETIEAAIAKARKEMKKSGQEFRNIQSATMLMGHFIK